MNEVSRKNTEIIERAGRLGSLLFRAGSGGYLITCGKEFATHYRSGGTPSSTEWVLQNRTLFQAKTGLLTGKS